MSVCIPVSADDLRDRLRDENGKDSDVWVYNDIPAAMAAAKKAGKPLFVTFRCVPCRDCAAFDADVASGNERVREFAKERFISVRQVEMKNVDLSQFQFDYDLNWAAMFLNADGTVYARYGTQSAKAPTLTTPSTVCWPRCSECWSCTAVTQPTARSWWTNAANHAPSPTLFSTPDCEIPPNTLRKPRVPTAFTATISTMLNICTLFSRANGIRQCSGSTRSRINSASEWTAPAV
ncbi:MAG UNVERIFIED_CONTAM: thioredoxin family protein [Planctomycetaceae bacterium]